MVTQDRDKPRPTAFTLWCQARDEHPNDQRARRRRYLDLMTQHGHIIKREPGDHRPLLPCQNRGTTP